MLCGNGVDVKSAYQDMNTLQSLYRKNDGRRYLHYIISFDKGVPAMKAYHVAFEIASYFAGDYQYMMAVHINTSNIHAHVILSAVNARTGKKFSQSKKQLREFRNYVNFCLDKHGLNMIPERESNRFMVEETDSMEFEDFSDILEDYDEPDNTIGVLYNFFGPVDEYEAQMMRETEKDNLIRKQIIEYFEGKSCCLPCDYLYEEALEIYQQWQDYISFSDEYDGEDY